MSWGRTPYQSKTYFVENRSRVFVVKYDGEDVSNSINDNANNPLSVSESDFLDLWYDSGELNHLEKYIQGYKPEGKGSFKVTFTDVGNDEIKALEKQLYSQTVTFKNAKGKKLKLQLFRPRTPIKTVTLRPVPLEYDLVKLKDVLSQFNWGVRVREVFLLRSKRIQYRH